MSVLTLAPRNWFTWNFSLLDGERLLADIHFSSWRERGVLTVEGVDYSVYRESMLGDFLLERAGSMVASRETKRVPALVHHQIQGAVVHAPGRVFLPARVRAPRRRA